MTLHLRETDQAALEKLASVVTTAELSADGARGLARLVADLDGLKTDASPWEFLTTYLLDRTDLLAVLTARDTEADRMRGRRRLAVPQFYPRAGPTGSGLPIQRTLDRVRQLVLLAEERDLRQVPAGALHMDAVRLMTVHGSKGLEFEAVHVPGLTVSSFPSSNRGQRCPAPDGMIMGAEHLTGAEEAKRAHSHEEECLFFVAASRARTPSPPLSCPPTVERPQPSGIAVPRLVSGTGLEEVPRPPTLPLPPDAPRPALVPIAWPERLVRHQHEAPVCTSNVHGASFFTHMCSGSVGAGSLQRSPARMIASTTSCSGCRLHLSGDIGEDVAMCEFDRIWQASGPTDHAFAADYRRLADRLVRALVRLGAGQRFRKAEPLAIDFPNGRVLVQPEEMTELPNGTVVLRRVRTGYKRSDEYDRLDYTLYHLAARARYGAAYVVEALHLTDESIETVAVSTTRMNHRRTKSEDMLAGITAGRFSPAIDAVRCPRCPHFFICAATPRGPLRLI